MSDTNDTNNVTLSGRLARDVAVYDNEGRAPVAKFTIVVKASWQGKESSSFIRCEAWGDASRQALGGVEGDRLVVCGRLKGAKKKDGTWETVVGAKTVFLTGVPAVLDAMGLETPVFPSTKKAVADDVPF